MADSRPIGVFDSGLGGLTVVKELKRLLPDEDIIYLGDTARVPYGNKSAETIIRCAREIEGFLLKQDVKMIVAACGTVSSVASFTESELPVKFMEVVSHSVRSAVEKTENGKIGVLATRATIKSSAHKKQILALLPNATVVESSASLLVPLVEEGWTSPDDEVVLETAKRYLKDMKAEGVDTVILGCTHFPILENTIKKIMGDGVNLINMGASTAVSVRAYLTDNDMLNGSGGNLTLYTTDKPQSFKRLASLLLGEEIVENQVSQVDIKEI